MDQKPNDLLLSVIDFFGILIPGTALAFLHGDLFLGPLGWSIAKLQSPSDWIPAFLVSYVLGHFLLGFSAPLNRLAARLLWQDTRVYFESVRTRVNLPAGLSATPTHVFYSAYSYIRIHSSEAMSEVERQAAEYKLFRSLTLLFLLDLLILPFSGSFSPWRIGLPLLGLGLAAYRFWWLLNWTYQLAYDFYLQLEAAPAKGQ